MNLIGTGFRRAYRKLISRIISLSFTRFHLRIQIIFDRIYKFNNVSFKNDIILHKIYFNQVQENDSNAVCDSYIYTNNKCVEGKQVKYNGIVTLRVLGKTTLTFYFLIEYFKVLMHHTI